MMEFPSSRENPMSTHGRKGAWKFKRPKKFMRTFGLRLLHMYTSIMVKAWPKNTRLTNVPNICTTIKKITIRLIHSEKMKKDLVCLTFLVSN